MADQGACEPTNPTYADELRRRNEAMERTLKRAGANLPLIDLRSHCHATVHGGMVHMCAWLTDPVTKEREYTRIALPYDHFLLIARGIVDAHEENKSLPLHTAEGG